MRGSIPQRLASPINSHLLTTLRTHINLAPQPIICHTKQ
uniref:Uncharacterized protein n=1 Tax=Arundo donax TaxID=35708 RepID=A0A0A9BIC6_ARUDO